MSPLPEVQVVEKTKTSNAIKLVVGIGVVAVIAIGASLSFGLAPRQPIVEYTGNPTCTDTDPGTYTGSYGKVAVKGVTKGYDRYGRTYSSSDWCAGDGISVYEQFCVKNPDGSGKLAAQSGFACKNGCLNGACVGTEARSCTDSQPVPDITGYGHIQGVDTNGEFYRFDDACVDNTGGTVLTNTSATMLVNKYSCGVDASTRYIEEKFSCPSGQCTNGKCFKCTDTDAGKDYSIQGTVKDSFDSVAPNLQGPRTFNDQCIVYINANGYQDVTSCTSADDRCSVREGFCTSDYYDIESHLCPNGCSSGKCL